ncbi:MBL fold metallo-hydrolase [Domibacillus sp. DTU_2020_1001157_1_SI_ALB_TIR_016]|uniref:MBL fold metallo-hydrolase n=1 Tax=Domibacillus sp. DTU_2020_1001157_1_SI_ALB_TIR_016 TaxID=3077789 RepID=UPI0028E55180|nr:MBL fold metallo-hydrolase [Domibacillus sp. DTU_2020_1001157_1_SI_ALB_TIR_016]WNS80531.1 MBL fold metallo-hydrolase [Domibacillus sp. DTU_2020_1001157_1_SI_ALB_TIR_016]
MEQQMTYGSDYKFIPATSVKSGESVEVVPGIVCHTIQIVNICLVGDPDTGEFVLVDAGMPGSAEEIISVSEKYFGAGSRPKAIILTHGHFDHVGAVIELVKHWQVTVYAHELELPHLTGHEPYPKPDATVEGGMVAKMSPLFPREPINLGGNVEKLPSDGEVPHLPDFRWIHTPGHSPGHISLFRDKDRLLLAGDAFVTVKQDSFYKVVTQKEELNGPPRYLTTDWEAAKNSVAALEKLKPAVTITGHGRPMSGSELSDGLAVLVQEFDRVAVPDYGKYVDEEK